MSAIFKRELKSYFTGFLGYIFCAFILLFAGIYTMAICLKQGAAAFEYVVGNMSFIFLIAIPILSMKAFAEERRQKTDILLYSLPLNMTDVVLGKFFALISLLFVPVVIMCLYPLSLSIYGKVNMFASYGTLFAFFMLGVSLLSMGLFISSLTESQVIAVIATFLLVLINYLIGTFSNYFSYSTTATFYAFAIIILLFTVFLCYFTKSYVFSILIGSVLEIALSAFKVLSSDSFYGLFPRIMKSVSVFDRFYTFPDGVFDITAIIYYAAITVVFVFLTVQSMEKRRWS